MVRTVPVGTRLVEFSVGPLVRMDGLSILTINALDTSDPAQGDPVNISALWNGLYPGANGVRLLDGESMTAEEAAQDQHPIYTTGSLIVPEDAPLEMHVVFGGQEDDETNVLVPFAGLFTKVPVVDEDGSTSELREAFDDLVPDPNEVNPQVADLSSFSVSLDEDLDARSSADEVVVNLTADVLFSYGKADLSKKAEKSLKAAANKFAGYSGGALTITGHTDDQGPKDFNQELSEDRARAVADRLAVLGDLERFDVEVAGRGMTEPRVEDTSEEARALNRRVELVLKPEGEVDLTVESDPEPIELPKSSGPSGFGGEGVVLEGRDDAKMRVRMDSVARVGQTLVGELHISHVAGEVTSVGVWFSLGTAGIRGGFQPYEQYTPANLTLAVGDERFYPLDFRSDPEDEDTLPLTESRASAPLPEDGEYVLTAVWPDVAGPEQSGVVLDVVNKLEEEIYQRTRPPFRLTDIPVE